MGSALVLVLLCVSFLLTQLSSLGNTVQAQRCSQHSTSFIFFSPKTFVEKHTFSHTNPVYHIHYSNTSLKANAQQQDSCSNSTSYSVALEFIRQCGKLKRTTRAGWLRRNITENVESVADHSWRVSVMCLLLFSQYPNEEDQLTNLNIGKCMQIAILHDLAECITGDICPDDNVSKETKYILEREAIHKLANYLDETTDYNANRNNPDSMNNGGVNCQVSEGSKFLLHLWQEYENRETEEARVVKDLDLLDMIVQADEYEVMIGENCNVLQDFFDTCQPHRIQNFYLKKLTEELHHQRNVRLERLQKKNPDQHHMTDQTNAIGHINNDLSVEDHNFIIEFSNAANLSKSEVEKVVSAYKMATNVN